MLNAEGVLRGKAGGKRNGRNGEGKAERLNEIVAVETERLYLGHGGDDEKSGAAGQ